MGLQWTLIVPYIIMNLQLVVIEWMYTAVRQSDQYTVRYDATPRTWRTNSNKSHEHNTTKLYNNEAASKWYMPKHNEDCRAIQKALKSIHIFNTRNGVTLTNLCTACSSRHSLIPHTYTAMYVYTYTAAHIPAQLCTYEHAHRSMGAEHLINTYVRIYTPTQLHSFVHTYVHVLKVVWTYTNIYKSAHRSMGAQHLLVVWDGILGHVGGLASESSAYTLYGLFLHTERPLLRAERRNVHWILR